MTKPNEKYIVFKRTEFYELMGKLALPPGSGAPSDMDCAPQAKIIIDETYSAEVDDAVVIRRQDMFAPPALNVYAHSISVAAKLLKRIGQDAYATDLQNIADYFHEQAELASEEAYKLPD